jgi:hypothetical protein
MAQIFYRTRSECQRLAVRQKDSMPKRKKWAKHAPFTQNIE